jgi:hypothetical protein
MYLSIFLIDFILSLYMEIDFVIHAIYIYVGAISGGTGVGDGYGFVALNLLLPLAVTVVRGTYVYI